MAGYSLVRALISPIPINIDRAGDGGESVVLKASLPLYRIANTNYCKTNSPVKISSIPCKKLAKKLFSG